MSAVHIRAVVDRARCFSCANKLRLPVGAAYCAHHFWSFSSGARLLCGRSRRRVRGTLGFWFVVGVARSRALTTFVWW